MKIFDWMYKKCINLARHKHAPYYLVGISTAESVIFPIPVDVMLAPMVMAQKSRAWWLAFITSVASVVGGVIGYLLGFFSADFILPLLESSGYHDKYLSAVEWFDAYGVWVVFIAGFSPIPYKVFTVSAGILHMAFVPFLLASAVGRSARFFLVAAILYFGGDYIDKMLQKYVERIGWAVVLLCVVLYFLFKF